MTKATEYMTALNTADINGVAKCARCGSSGDTYVLCSGCGAPAQQAPSHVEQTPAGTIDWKAEVARLNRLLAAADPFMEDYKRDTVNGMAHRIHELEAALQAIAQNARHEAFMEAAAIAQRWADEAAEFHDARSETMQNVCRNLAQAIRNRVSLRTKPLNDDRTGSVDS